MNPNYQVIISAKDQTKQAFDSIIGNISKIDGLIVGLGLSLSVGGFTSIIKQAADFNDEMSDMAQTLGTTTESLSALQYAAKFGGGVDELNTGLAKLAKNASEAADGGKAAQASFNKIGIDPTKYKDTSALFEAIVGQLSQLPDGIQKTAIAQELLGKSGAKLLPLINQGTAGIKAMREEAERLGLVVSQKDADAAGEFNDNLDRLALTSKGLAVQFGNEFVPALNEVAKKALEAAKQGSLLDGVLKGIAATGEVIIFGTEQEQRAKRIYELANFIKFQSESLAGFSKDSNPQILEDLRAKIAKAKEEMKELIKIQSEPFNRKPTTPQNADLNTSNTEKSEAEKKAEAAAKAAANFVESLKKQADQLGLTKTQQLQYEASLLSLTSAEKKQVEVYLEKIRVFDKNIEAKKAVDEMNKASFEAEEQRQKELIQWDMDQINRQQASIQAAEDLSQKLIDQNEQLTVDLIESDSERAKARLAIENKRIVETIEAMNVEQEVINDLLEKQADNYAKQLEKVNQDGKKTGNSGKDLGLIFKSSFEDAVVGGKKFSEVLSSLGQDIERLAMRRLVLEPILNAFDNLLGDFNIGDIFSPVIKNANGGVYSGAGISQFSNSVVNKPTLFPFAKGIGLMGEAGPEAILPLTRINGELGVKAVSGGGGDVYNVSVSVDATGGSVAGDNEKAVNLGQQIERAVKSVLLNEKRPGGLLA